MEEEYKPNSHKFREQQNAQQDKQVEKVVSGAATTRKKNEIQKLADVFISEDVENVKNYILMDVLVPTIKKAISDIVTNSIDMILYGESGSKKKDSTSATKVSYGSCYNRENERKDRSNNTLRGFDYDILFETRGDAEAVLDAMNDIIREYRMISVSDLYDLANVENSNFALDKYGWYDIRGSKAVRVRDGYILRLPKPVPLN